ncbi:MAG: hypothetical protein GY710_15685 [Desulfobacteraceae bacterium]|nr:hypothetical protein [Desulfobacteraceae bacterium]
MGILKADQDREYFVLSVMALDHMRGYTETPAEDLVFRLERISERMNIQMVRQDFYEVLDTLKENELITYVKEIGPGPEFYVYTLNTSKLSDLMGWNF